MTSHVPEWKKSWTLSKTPFEPVVVWARSDIVTGAAFRPRTPRGTRFLRRRPAKLPRTRTRSAGAQPPSSYGLGGGEVCEQVQRPRHQDGPVVAGERAREPQRVDRALAGLRSREPWRRKRCKFRGRERTRSRRLRRHEHVADSRQRREHPGGVLVAQDRRDDHVAARRQPRQ